MLREKVIPGATVVVNPANEDEEGEVRLTVVKPKKQKTPVGVGAEGAVAELPEGEGVDLPEDPGDLADLPELSEGDGAEQAPSPDEQ